MSVEPAAGQYSARRHDLFLELRDRVEAAADHGHENRVPGMLVSRAEAPTEPGPSQTGTVVALIVQGAKRVALGDRIFDYGPGQYLVASIDMPITGHYSRASRDVPALGFGLLLRPKVVGELLLATASEPIGRSVVPPSALGVADASDELLDAAVRMLRLLESRDDAAVLAPMLEREILWRILCGPLGAIVRQIGIQDSSLSRISEAVRWIAEHHAQPFQVQELAARSNMSASAFHRAFRAVTASSSIRFQKQIRLREARLLLLGGQTDVAGAGYRVGYRSTTQFSREYRREFGVSPGRDAARLRGHLHAVV